jgi:hypothetical protein
MNTWLWCAPTIVAKARSNSVVRGPDRSITIDGRRIFLGHDETVPLSKQLHGVVSCHPQIDHAVGTANGPQRRGHWLSPWPVASQTSVASSSLREQAPTFSANFSYLVQPTTANTLSGWASTYASATCATVTS